MRKWLVALLVLSSLSACVPVVFVGGAALGMWIGSDPRKPEAIKEDFDTGAQLSARVVDTYKDRAHVNVNVFNDLVLLTGEVPDEAAKQQIEQFAWQRAHRPRKVFNELVVAAPSSTSARLNDSQLSVRVKTAVLAEAGDASAVHIMIVTERQTVYLMGIAKPAIVEKAARAASRVSGVKQVVKLVELDAAKPGDSGR